MKPARGFGLPAAIFLLVVLALLGAFMVTISSTGQITSAQDVQGARAFQAAKGGMERALFELRCSASSPPASCPASMTQAQKIALCTNVSTWSPLTIDGFSVAVTCTTPATPHDEGGISVYLYRVVSTATAGGTPGGVGYIERMQSAVIEF